MKKKIFFLLIFLLACLAPLPSHGTSLPQRLSGEILLQVEEHGEAWYVYPANRLRYYLGRPADAFSIMRGLGLGISEEDYGFYKDNIPSRLYGFILLRVEENGEAYYADKNEDRFIYLGRPADAFRIMREKGIGITNGDLDHMPVSGASAVPPDGILNIFTDKPDWNEKIQNPAAITGLARVFEGTVNIRVRNSNDKILAETYTTAASPEIGEFGPFSKIVSYSSPGTEAGYVEVFARSAKDGSEINKVITLVRF